MTLLLVFAVMAVGLFALFLGGTLVAQGYLYQQPADRLPLRALAGAVLLAGFLTAWAAVDKGQPGRYDTFFNFSGYTTTEFTEFEAVRWPVERKELKTDASGAQVEEVVKFKRSAGGKGADFIEEGTNKPFALMTGQYMTGAIRVQGPGDAAPVRYNAVVTAAPGGKTKYYPDVDQRRFVEEKGSRYVTAAQPGTLFVPSTGTVAGALMLNFLLLVTWLVVVWPVLRFTLGHALLLAAVGTLVVMLAFMPLLFKFTRGPAAPPPVVSSSKFQQFQVEGRGADDQAFRLQLGTAGTWNLELLLAPA